MEQFYELTSIMSRTLTNDEKIAVTFSKNECEFKAKIITNSLKCYKDELLLFCIEDYTLPETVKKLCSEYVILYGLAHTTNQLNDLLERGKQRLRELEMEEENV